MPKRGYRAIGVTLKEDDYLVLQERLKEMGYGSLSELVRAILRDRIRAKTLEVLVPEGRSTSTNHAYQGSNGGSPMEVFLGG
ncbi:MAG: hypothetical protein QW220_05135 [Candidatus Bathyarchaeia archaeon]